MRPHLESCHSLSFNTQLQRGQASAPEGRQEGPLGGGGEETGVKEEDFINRSQAQAVRFLWLQQPGSSHAEGGGGSASEPAPKVILGHDP